jgi:hypothetical protein
MSRTAIAAHLAGHDSNVIQFRPRVRRLDCTGQPGGPSEIDRIIRLVWGLHLKRELTWHDVGVIHDALILLRGAAR